MDGTKNEREFRISFELDLPVIVAETLPGLSVYAEEASWRQPSWAVGTQSYVGALTASKADSPTTNAYEIQIIKRKVGWQTLSGRSYVSKIPSSVLKLDLLAFEMTTEKVTSPHAEIKLYDLPPACGSLTSTWSSPRPPSSTCHSKAWDFRLSSSCARLVAS